MSTNRAHQFRKRERNEHETIRFRISLWRRAIELFLPAGRNENDGLLQPVMDLANRYRTSTAKLTESLAARLLAGVVHETLHGWLVVNFKKRQTSASYERVKRCRERYRNGQCNGEVATGPSSSTSPSTSSSKSFSSLEEGGTGGETKCTTSKPAPLRVCFPCGYDVTKNSSRPPCPVRKPGLHTRNGANRGNPKHH